MTRCAGLFELLEVLEVEDVVRTLEGGQEIHEDRIKRARWRCAYCGLETTELEAHEKREVPER